MNKLLIVILVLALAACGNSKKNKAGSTNAEDITLTGAGATFPLPYYNLAFKTYKDSTGVAVNYGGSGLGGGSGGAASSDAAVFRGENAGRVLFV